jgi:hypothetical protein
MCLRNVEEKGVVRVALGYEHLHVVLWRAKGATKVASTHLSVISELQARGRQENSLDPIVCVPE